MNKPLHFAAAAAATSAAVVWYYSRSEPEADIRSGAPLVEVRVPVLAGDAIEGVHLFNANCAQCHGDNAAGRKGVAPPLVHKIYEPGHHSDQSFYLATQRGVRQHHWSFGDMPPVEGISEPEVVKIIAFVRELQRANGIN